MCHCHLERRASEEVHKVYMWYKGYAVLGVSVDGGGVQMRALGHWASQGKCEVRHFPRSIDTTENMPPYVSRISQQYMIYAIYEMQYNTQFTTCLCNVCTNGGTCKEPCGKACGSGRLSSGARLLLLGLAEAAVGSQGRGPLHRW